jgi:hypothetical protein
MPVISERLQSSLPQLPVKAKCEILPHYLIIIKSKRGKYNHKKCTIFSVEKKSLVCRLLYYPCFPDRPAIRKNGMGKNVIMACAKNKTGYISRQSLLQGGFLVRVTWGTWGSRPSFSFHQKNHHA